jgi:hypothetical protein
MGISPPVDSTLVGARVDWRKNNHEVLVFGRANAVEGTPTSASQNGWIETGAALAGFYGSISTSAQYTFRDYLLDDTANSPPAAGTMCVTCNQFVNAAGSGVIHLQEVALDVTWRNTGRNGKKTRAAIGGFARVYDLQTPYVQTSNDARFGGRLDFQYWFTRALHAGVGAELAQTSPTLQRELAMVSSVRAMVEARW